jgi:hypothetical protein
MTTRVRKTRTTAGHKDGPLGRLQQNLDAVVGDARKVVRSRLRRIEKRAGDAQVMARRQVAGTLRELAKRIRRLEKAVAPPQKPAKKRRAVKTRAAKDRGEKRAEIAA